MEAEILRIANEAKSEANKANMNANAANAKISSHEDICAIRYSGIIESVDALKWKIDAIMNKAMYVAGTIILLLLSAVTSLAVLLLGGHT